MRPLVFLAVRTFVNSIKRALTSPKRIVGLIFFLGYYYFAFLRTTIGAVFAGGGPSGSGKFPMQLSLPPLEILHASVFGILSCIFVLQLLSLGNKNIFRQADVDVLFPTPVSPGSILAFRIFRDTMFSIFLPLLFLVFSWRPVSPILTSLFANAPAQSGYVFRVFTLVFLASSFAFTCLDHAVTLAIYRNDATAKRNYMIIFWSLFAFVGVAGYRAWWLLKQGESFKDRISAIGSDSVLNGFLFYPAAATKAILGPLEGSWASTLGGIAVILGTAAIGILACQRQLTYMFDSATIRTATFEKVRAAKQAPDAYSTAVRSAQEGKIRSNWGMWVSRIVAVGPLAIVWKNTLIAVRSTGPLGLILFILPVGYIIGFTFYLAPEVRNLTVNVAGGPSGMKAGIWGELFLSMPVALLGSLPISLGMGQGNVLRLTDLTKPLPFASRSTMFWEVSGGLILAAVTSLPSILLFVALNPYYAFGAVCSYFVAIGFVALSQSNNLLAYLLAPDRDDPTQRAFRGLVFMLGFCLLLSIPFGCALVVGWLTWGSRVALIPIGAVFLAASLGIAFLCSLVNGNLFDEFNWNE